MSTKLYCYVDETGIDTEGELFMVAVVITAENRDEAISLLEQLEKQSGKYRRKWTNTGDSQQVDYMRLVLSNPFFEGTLSYSVFHDDLDYQLMTVEATARAITAFVDTDDYLATVLVDALQKSQVDAFSVGLRRRGITIKKVRGIRKEEHDALLRLADAICGFTRAASDGHKEFSPMLAKALKQGYIKLL